MYMYMYVAGTDLADCMNVVNEPLLASVWLRPSLLPLVAAEDEAGEEARPGFSSLLSSFRNPTNRVRRGGGERKIMQAPPNTVQLYTLHATYTHTQWLIHVCYTQYYLVMAGKDCSFQQELWKARVQTLLTSVSTCI